ncbi:MAG: hypothetical protein OEZ09_16920, partial [Betaproteobacteria bacterium]|nr:hypothetical protein [Betaproteobacteria bacterium]
RKITSVPWVLSMCVGLVAVSQTALAGDEKPKEGASVVEQMGMKVKEVAATIEREVTGVVKKLEESETPKKIGNELKRSANAVGEKIENAGKKLKQSFNSE